MKLYPSLTKNNFKLINAWIKQYIKTFAAENKDVILDNKDEKVTKRKRVLPRTALKRIKEVFDHLDEDQKGCKKKFLQGGMDKLNGGCIMYFKMSQRLELFFHFFAF